jgi:hypothetical protein
VEAVIVALIGVVGSVLVVLVEKGRKENARDHGIVADKLELIKGALEDIDDDIAHVESKLDNHLSDHITASLGGFDIDDLTYKTGEKVKDKKKVKKHGSKKR